MVVFFNDALSNLLVFTDVSEKLNPSSGLFIVFMTEAVGSPETSISIWRNTQYYTPEDSHFHNLRCVTFKPLLKLQTYLNFRHKKFTYICPITVFTENWRRFRQCHLHVCPQEHNDSPVSSTWPSLISSENTTGARKHHTISTVHSNTRKSFITNHFKASPHLCILP
jgi:hypothetical protein